MKQPNTKKNNDELQFKDIFVEYSLTANIAADNEGIINYINPAFLKMWGYVKKEDIIGKPVSVFIESENEAKQIIEILNKEKKWDGEYLAKRKNGSTFISRGFASILKNYEGKQVGFMFSNIDVTEQKKANEEISKSEERFRKIFEEGSLGMVFTDREFKFLRVNSAFCKMIGYKEKELLNLTFTQITHPDHIDKDVENVKKLFKSEISVYRTEKRYIKKNKEIFWGNLTVSKIIDEHGNFLHFLVMIEDITLRKKAEENLRERESLLTATLESTRDGILVVDNNARVTHYNEKFLKMWSIPLELIESRDDSKLLDFVVKQVIEPDKFLQKIQKLYESSESDYGIILFKDGKIFERTSFPLFIDGQISGRVWDFSDITERKKIEEALIRSEDKFRKIFENVQDVYYQANSAGIIIEISPSVEKYSDFKRDELIGKSVNELYFYKNERIELLKEIEEKGEIVDFVIRLKSKDNRLIYTSVNAHILYDSFKKPIGIEGFLRDITERRNNEESLRISEEKYKSLYENTPVMLHSIDENGRILSVSNFWLKVLGYTRDEVIGRKSTDFLTEASKKYASEEGLPDFFKTGYCTDIQYQYVKKNGEVIDISLSAISEKNKEGKVTRSLAVLTDVTERNKAEKILKINQKRLRQIIDLDPNFVFAKDIEGKFILVNQAVADAYGTTVKTLIGKKDSDYAKSDEEVRQFREKDLDVINSGKPLFIKEETITDSKGKIRHLQTTKIPFTFSGTSTPAVLGVSTDITEQKRSATALRESEETLRTFINALSELAFLIDKDFRILFANNSLADVYNATPDKIIGKTFFELLPNVLGGQRKINIEKVFKESKQIIFEDTRNNRNFMNYFYPIIDARGEVTKVAGFAFDITERLKAERENILLAQTIKSVQDVISVTDMNDTIIFVNDSFLKTYGYTEKELIGRNISTVRSVEISREITREIYMQTMKGGWHGELINCSKDGTKFPIELWTSIVKDNNGNNVATVGVARDITERKFAEDALKQSEEKYRSLVENLSVGVFQNSLDGSILQANPAFVKIFEFNSIDEILKTNVSDLYQNKEDRRIFLDELNKYGFVHNKELKLKKKDGSLIWASVSARAFLNDKKEIIWYNGVIDDITSIKKANQALIEAKDKAEESERIKSNFLANMSHELRTPMVGILGYSEFLRENSKDQEIKLMADTINKSGTRLLETLNLILDLSRLEQDKVDLNFEKTNIVNIARDVLNLFQVSAKSKNIKLELECSLENIFAYIDQRILHQILNNLINNAIKFTDSGSVTVMISEEIKSGKDWSVIKVKDTGIGIPKDKQNIIFEEFRQVSEGFNRSFEGTGLGLTITKNFVEAMKGEIKVESKIGEGSTFTVSFPSGKTSLAKSDDKEISSGKSGNKIMSRENYNVLCVDDEVTSNKLVKAILNKICNVDFAFEGKSALELLGLKKYDTILMDINLGTGMSGIEVIKKIKKIPAYIKTPIIALTAFAMRGDKEEFLSMGCDYYLSKPYTQNELREIVIEAIEKGNK